MFEDSFDGKEGSLEMLLFSWYSEWFNKFESCVKLRKDGAGFNEINRNVETTLMNHW
jgi:hypothetical protein